MARTTMPGMRGDDRQPDAMFSYVSAEQRVPKEHPLRTIRTLVDGVLHDMSGIRRAVRDGWPPIDPARALAAGPAAADLYSIRSERLLMEQLDYNLLFRRFVGLEMDEPIWDVTVFTKHRDRLLNRRLRAASSGASWSAPRT